ncbi:uncharacterized protein LOC109728035 [Ananas comosus]|uniref:Uncharacterized protein LOC109704683 n=2 Tax=Ananas comosus TaxID=4615 RepID=A0A6P5EHM0_ANACO|nr:uncharacterized protein LOC109704683 [Ananas comosus]XP_020113901.1 uncharacterized protein LOC109728035 [Ananas comosus]
MLSCVRKLRSMMRRLMELSFEISLCSPWYLNNTPQPFSYLNFPLFFSQPKKQTSEGIVGEEVAFVFGLVGDAKVGKPVLEAANLRFQCERCGRGSRQEPSSLASGHPSSSGIPFSVHVKHF